MQHVLENVYFQTANNNGADQSARMRILNSAFVVCTKQNHIFSLRFTYKYMSGFFLCAVYCTLYVALLSVEI